ncbi:MAG: glycoside hydrolase family 16 protein [Verrucomicrobiota bacterium]
MNSTFRFAAGVVSSVFLCAAAGAGNLLTNPGFEMDPTGHSKTLLAWSMYGNNPYNESGAVAHSGTNYFKVYQGFTGNVNYTGIYQDNASGPGAIYAADAWAYTASGDALAGGNVAWIEVTFRDATGNMLALYRSAAISGSAISSGAFPKNTWVQLYVTNQYNTSNYQLIGTVTNLVAPAQTSYVRYQVVLQGDAANSGGSIYFDDLNLVPVGPAPLGDWNMVWSDEFNGTTINPAVWTFDTGNGTSGWGNNELEYYTSRSINASVSSGILHIVARKESIGGYSFSSARMKTQGLFSRKYGRFEFRAKFPAGLGYWPALWMLGTNITVPGYGWPKCGEIDVAEVNGSSPSVIVGSIHSGSDATQSYTIPGGSSTDFHTYMVEWNTNSFVWYVDGIPYETQTTWSSSVGPYPTPFDKPFFIIMNLAVGGNFVGNPTVAAINASTPFPGDMQVDYVRIYDHTAPLQLTISGSSGSPVLTWPTNIVCHLQSRTSLANDTDTWADVPGAASPYSPPAGDASFYRLVSP